jgi:hypothetical protein
VVREVEQRAGAKTPDECEFPRKSRWVDREVNVVGPQVIRMRRHPHSDVGSCHHCEGELPCRLSVLPLCPPLRNVSVRERGNTQVNEGILGCS